MTDRPNPDNDLDLAFYPGLDLDLGDDPDQDLDDGEATAGPEPVKNSDRLYNAWDRFWFAPRANTTITVVRFALGLVSLVWALSWFADLQIWLGEDAILPRPGHRPERIALFRYWYNDTALFIVYASLVLASICLMVGQYVKLSAVVVWYALVSMQLEAITTLNAADGLLRIWAFYFALFAVFTPSRFISTPILGVRGADGKRTWPAAPAWILRIMQIQLTIIYVSTVIAKMPGDMWREGRAAQYALGLEDFQRMWIPDFVRQDAWIGNLMTWSAFGIELALPFLLWTKRTRRIGLVLGLGMHAAFDYSMRLGFFFPALIIGYLAFFADDELARPLRWIGDKVDSRKSRAAESASANPGPDADSDLVADGDGPQPALP